MTNGEDIDMLAAEYVLGSLSAEEREDVRARQHGEPALATAIADWERRLLPLSHREPGLEPPPQVLERILAGIREQGAAVPSDMIAGSRIAGEPTTGGDSLPSNVIQLQRRVTRWQQAAGAMAAMAAALAIVLAAQYFLPRQQSPGVSVAILDSSGSNVADEPSAVAKPAFLASFDPQSRRLVIRQIAGRAASASRIYTLWLKGTDGAAARALVQIARGSTGAGVSVTLPASLDISKSWLIITLEREDSGAGSGPRGPVISRGKLMTIRP